MENTLKLLLPIFEKMSMREAIKVVDAANEALRNTPWMYFVTGDGVRVVRRKDVMAFAKALQRAEAINGGYLNG